ncbi:hypothetical protein MK546_06935, partial [Streptococcus cristatus]
RTFVPDSFLELSGWFLLSKLLLSVGKTILKRKLVSYLALIGFLGKYGIIELILVDGVEF